MEPKLKTGQYFVILLCLHEFNEVCNEDVDTFYTSSFVMVQYVSRVGSNVWHRQHARVKQEISAYREQVGYDSCFSCFVFDKCLVRILAGTPTTLSFYLFFLSRFSNTGVVY